MKVEVGAMIGLVYAGTVKFECDGANYCPSNRPSDGSRFSISLISDVEFAEPGHAVKISIRVIHERLRTYAGHPGERI